MRDRPSHRWTSRASFAALVLLASLSLSCGGNDDPLAKDGLWMPMRLRSPAFGNGKAIPAQYTCDGENVSPPLRWSVPPPGALSLALICDDPDAPGGTWSHWVLYAIPPTQEGLTAGIPATDLVLEGARQGKNGFDRLGYSGPCPPAGKPHRYLFRLYALDVQIDLPPGASQAQLEQAMEGHVVGRGVLRGTYRRKKQEALQPG